MLLENKNAVIYGAAGSVGSTVARAFAREGAKVYLTARDVGALEDLAKELGNADTAQVDASSEEDVERHLASIQGTVDVSFNAIGIPQRGIQGIPLTELSVGAFMKPSETYLRAHFVTVRAAARRMITQRSGVILAHTPEPARMGATLVGGMGPMWAALEGLNRGLSAEVAPHGVRAVVLRTTGMPETPTIDVVFSVHAEGEGVTREQFEAMAASFTHRRRATSLAELADVAAFVASDRAAAMTGTVANLTGGIIVD